MDVSRYQTKQRSTYSSNNALQFKLLFDQLIENPQNTFVPCSSFPTIGWKTLQQRLSDGLLYLAREHDNMVRDDKIPPSLRAKTTQKDYLALKGLTKFRLTSNPEPGVMVNVATCNIVSMANKVLRDSIVKNYVVGGQFDWKGRVIAWIEGGCTLPVVLDIANLMLNPEDVEWLKDMFLKNNCEFKIDGLTGFRAVKTGE